MRGAAALGADLHDAVVPPGRIDHAPALEQVVRDRFLDVDVLARLAGPDRGQGVPVVRGGDGDGGDVLVLQHLADVLDDARRLLLALVDRFQRVGHVGVVDLADGDDVHVVEDGEAADEVTAAAADAHDGEVDAFVGLLGGARGGGGGEGDGGGRGGGFQELAAVECGHGGTSCGSGKRRH